MKHIFIGISIIGFFISFLVIKSNKTLLGSIVTAISLGFGIMGFSSKNSFQSMNKIVIAISPDYAPFAYIEKGEIKGIDLELINYIGKKLNKEIVLKPVEFSFLVPTLMKNEADIVMGGLSDTEERKKELWSQNITFTVTYCYPSTGILLQSNIDMSKVNANFNGKILVQTGSLFLPIIKERFPNANILSRDDFNLALEEFKQEKADIIIGDTVALIYFRKKNLEKNYLIFKVKHKLNSKTSNGNAFILKKNNKNLNIEVINRIIMEYKKKNKLFFSQLEEIKTI